MSTLEEVESMSDLIKEEIVSRHEDVDLFRYKIEKASKTRKLLGKNFEEWQDFFRINVQYPATPQDVMRYCAMFVEKSDWAYRLKTRLERELSTYKMSYDEKYNQEISKHALNKSRKIVPSKETLEVVAESQMGIRRDILTQYENDIAFFQSMIYKLKDTMDAIKTLGMSNGTQLRGELGFQA